MQKPRPPRGANSTKKPPPDIEILPPGGAEANNGLPNIYADIAAQINQYTDRPDLLLETLERHDPGFIKTMNEESRAYAKKSRDSRFNFGRTQAYSSLAIQIVAAAALLYILYYLATQNALTATTAVGIGVVYAITQAGTSGFMKIIDQVHRMITGKTSAKK